MRLLIKFTAFHEMEILLLWILIRLNSMMFQFAQLEG